MADLEVDSSGLNTKNMLRIKADVEELVERLDDAQKSVDYWNAQIASKGPSASRESGLEGRTEEQKWISTRADLVVSVIGLSIEDLAEITQDPPRILAIKELLDSTGDDDWISIGTLRAAFGGLEHGLKNGSVSSLMDVFADLEKPFVSQSKEGIVRTTKILQATQLAVRKFATNPQRSIFDQPFNVLSDTPSECDELVKDFSAQSPAQRNRVPAQDDRVQALEDQVQTLKDQVQALKDRFQASEDRTRALEDALQTIKDQLSHPADCTQVKVEDGPDDGVQKEKTPLQTKAACSLIKRPSTAPEDKANVKRFRP
jgi:molecular chaperone GrpE (heat shock protein)